VQVLLPVPGAVALGGVYIQGGWLQPRGSAAQGAGQGPLPFPRVLRQRASATIQGTSISYKSVILIFASTVCTEYGTLRPI
jgi:hypothetical protein